MLHPPPLTFFVRVLSCVNGKGDFSAILRAEWPSCKPTVFKVPLRKLLHVSQIPGSLYGWLSARGGFHLQKKKGKITELLRSKLEQWVHVRILPLAHEQTAARKKLKVNIRGTSAYSPSPRLHTQQLCSGNECSTWKQRFLSGRAGWACLWWRLITEEVIKAIGGTREAADMGEKANIKGMKGIIKQSWKDVKSWLGNQIWQRKKKVRGVNKNNKRFLLNR